MFARILVPIDGSAAAARAVATAIDLATTHGADLALLTVVDVRLTYAAEAGIPPSDLIASLRREGRELLLTTSLRLPPDLHPDELLREGEPATEIVAAARQWEADLIVIGSRGRGGLERLIGDGTADTVTRRAACAVLVVHAEAEAGAVGGWRRLLRWARPADEAGHSRKVTA